MRSAEFVLRPLGPQIDKRDREALRWKQALESGDEEQIREVGDDLLRQVHERIMNDDPNYREAGWT